MTKEIWKDIKGYEKFYKISSLGRIISKRTNIVCKTQTNTKRDYYEYISLRNEKGVSKSFRLSVLVAKHFIPNPDNKPQVNHIDCNKKNNQIKNLEWVTPKENMQHAILHNLINRPDLIGESNPNSKLKEKDVIFILGFPKKRKYIKELCSMFNVKKSCIERIIYGKSWKHIERKK